MIRTFEIGFDVFEYERGRFELSARVKYSLVHEVFALRIAAGAKCVNRECTNFWSKLNHTDVRSTGNTVSPFLSSFRCGIQREDSTVITIHPTDRETRFRILKILVPAFVKTLQAVDFAPRHFPRSKIALQCIQNLGKRCESIQVLIS